MKIIDNIIVQLLLLDGNESNLLDNPDDYKNFRRLIIELTKVKYDIRWCSNESCRCHPESTIKTILSFNPELREFLERFIKLDRIESILDNYEKTTVFDRDYIR